VLIILNEDKGYLPRIEVIKTALETQEWNMDFNLPGQCFFWMRR
jgi:hypothetical protein